MAYYSRVLSKNEDFPTFVELAAMIRAEHPEFRLTLEEASEEGGDEDSVEEWESLLLAGIDDVEVAVIERKPVFDGSAGQDDIADFLEDMQDCKPTSGVQWLEDYLASVKTVYAFQHLQGADTVEGGNVLHALRSALWERGDAIIQADGEGFTNEEGFHVIWQFSDSVSGPWKMGVLQDGVWHHFSMDLGDPDHRDAFLKGKVPDDLTATLGSGS